MQLKNALRKVNGDFEKLSKTLTTGSDASVLLDHIKRSGEVNLVFLRTIMKNISHAVMAALNDEENKKDVQLLSKILTKFQQIIDVLIAMPNVCDAMFVHMTNDEV